MFSRALWLLWTNDVFHGEHPPARPLTRGEKQRLILEVLQYKVAMIFLDIQRKWYVEHSDMPKRQPPLVVSLPYQLTEHETAAQNIFSPFAKSPFRESEFFAFLRKPDFSLPKNTELIRTQEIVRDRVDNYGVLIYRPNFFLVFIEVELANAIPAERAPDGYRINPPEAIADCYTYFFVVRMRSRFSRWTSGNWRTEEYKAWTDSTLKELQNRLAD